MFIVDDDDEYDEMIATIFALLIEGFNVKNCHGFVLCVKQHVFQKWDSPHYCDV